MADIPVHECEDIDTILEEMAEDASSSEVYSETELYSERAIASVAAQRTLGSGAGTGPAAVLRDDIDCGIPAKADAGFGTYNSVHTIRTSDNADGSWVEWYASFAAGTWAVAVRGYRWDGSGILKFSLDDGDGYVDIDSPPYGASSADLDQYGATDDQYYALVCDDLVIPAAGMYVLRATVTGKNPSSSGYATNIRHVLLAMVLAAP